MDVAAIPWRVNHLFFGEAVDGLGELLLTKLNLCFGSLGLEVVDGSEEGSEGAGAGEDLAEERVGSLEFGDLGDEVHYVNNKQNNSPHQ